MFDKPIVDIFMDFLGTNHEITGAKMILSELQHMVDIERNNMIPLVQRDLQWWNDKFPFKYYDLLTGKTLEEVVKVT